MISSTFHDWLLDKETPAIWESVVLLNNIRRSAIKLGYQFSDKCCKELMECIYDDWYFVEKHFPQAEYLKYLRDYHANFDKELHELLNDDYLKSVLSELQ